MPGRHSKGSRVRQFSIVIHDIKPTAKMHFQNVINALTPDWSLIAEEKYNHQDGSHLHIFIKYDQPRSWKEVLKFCEKQEQGGRVQVDTGRGSFQECRKYITDPDKEKNLDDSISENVRKLTLTEKYPDETRKCNQCNMLFFSPSPFTNGILAGKFRPTKCFKCTGRPKNFVEYLKKLSQENIPQDGTHVISGEVQSEEDEEVCEESSSRYSSN